MFSFSCQSRPGLARYWATCNGLVTLAHMRGNFRIEDDSNIARMYACVDMEVMVCPTSDHAQS